MSVRPGLLCALLLAGACHFNVDGVVPFAPVTAPDDAFTPPDPVDLSTSSTNDDAGVPPDLLAPAPDLTEVSFKVGDPCSDQCGGLLTCMTWVANGYCSQSCNGSIVCPSGSSCVDIGGAGGGNRYCLMDTNGSNNKCMRSDLECRDCGSNVCAPSGFCSGC